MRFIADANVLLPLLTEGHAHRLPAVDWWESCEDGDVGLCLPVRMALLRLLTNVRVMGSSILLPEQAWDVLCQLTEDPASSPLISRRPGTKNVGEPTSSGGSPRPTCGPMPGLPRWLRRQIATWPRSTAASAHSPSSS